MSDDYKYKNLPRAANGIAPAYWDEEEKQWLPYQGGTDMVKELNDIKATQDKILKRLDEPLDTNTQVIRSNVEDGIVTKPRSVEVFSEENIKVNAGSFVQYDSFSNELKYGTVQDMREYSHAYFGGQSFSGAHNYYLLMRQKPFGTGGSMIIDDKTETTSSTKYIKKTPITFHNLSLRVYNESEEEQTYTLGAGFWPV